MSLPLTGVRPISTIAGPARPDPSPTGSPPDFRTVNQETVKMLGQMMDMPLQVSSILRHAARHFGDT